MLLVCSISFGLQIIQGGSLSSQKMDLPEVQSHHQEAHWRPWCHDGWFYACRTYADIASPLQHQPQSCTSKAIQGFYHSSLQSWTSVVTKFQTKFHHLWKNTTDWDSVYRAMPMLEFHLSRIQISGIVHSQRSIQEDMMCLGGIHVPESLVPPGTLSPSVHWACLLPASSQLLAGHQIGRPCILLHSLLFPPSYLQETIKDYRCLTYDDTKSVNFCYIRVDKILETEWIICILIPLLYFLWCQIQWSSETLSICIH